MGLAMPRATYHVDESDVPVGVLLLDDGKMNSFDFETIREVNAALDQAEKDSTKAVIIAGTAKALSAGFDLKIMGPVLGKPGSKADAIKLVEEGGRLTTRIFAFPKPVIVAATGHCLALGAIILLAGDLRIAGQGSKSKVGLNETAIGMQLPAFGWRLAQYRLTSPALTRAVTQASVYDVAEAMSVGFVDKLVEGDVLAAALAEGKRLGGYVKQPAFAKIKAAERGEVISNVLGNIRQDVNECFPDPPSKL